MRASSVYGLVGVTASLGAGALAAAALSQGGSAPPPTRTITINAGEGVTGPTGASGEKGLTGASGAKGASGPQGATGPPGSVECIAGYSPGILVLNHPGGHTDIYTCISDASS